MLVLTGLKDVCEVEQTSSANKDYAKIVYNRKDGDLLMKNQPDIFITKNVFDCEVIALKVFRLVQNVLTEKTTWEQPTQLQLTYIEMHNVTIKLGVRWTGPYFKSLKISVDLVPCIPLCKKSARKGCPDWPFYTLTLPTATHTHSVPIPCMIMNSTVKLSPMSSLSLTMNRHS